MKKLRSFNLFMGFFHLVQGVLMVMLSNDFKLPLTTSYIEFNAQTQTLAPVIEEITKLPLGVMVAGFLFMSATAHFLLSVPGIYEWYTSNLKKGVNYGRWIEYSFSSSWMVVLIAMLTGVYDLSTLILIFGVNAMMILFGWMMELHNQSTKKTDWTSFIFGSIAGIFPWIVIALYLFNAGEGENKAPDFVYWIFFSIFLFFNSFAVNMVLQYKKVGKWKDYLFGEKVYIFMSLIAKSLLAWQVFAGTLRPE